MPFRIRNAYYLRISADYILPFYLYLDERHLEWMSEQTLRSVIADLKPLIGPKLESEKNVHYGPGGPASARRPTVDVHRGDHYQFAYFLRKENRHRTVLKWRNYVEASPQKPVPGPIANSFGKRKHSKSSLEEQRHVSLSKAKRQRTRQSTVTDLSDNGDDEYIPFAEDNGEDSDFLYSRDQAVNKQTIGFIDEANDEEFKKPTMQLNFRSLNMHDRCLCVVVEPWPPIHASKEVLEGHLSLSGELAKKPTVMQADGSELHHSPEPLFLIDENESEGIIAPSTHLPSNLEQDNVHWPNQTDQEDHNFLSFSQALCSVPGDHVGGPVEDDDLTGSVLYGDADEMRFIVQ